MILKRAENEEREWENSYCFRHRKQCLLKVAKPTYYAEVSMHELTYTLHEVNHPIDLTLTIIMVNYSIRPFVHPQ